MGRRQLGRAGSGESHELGRKSRGTASPRTDPIVLGLPPPLLPRTTALSGSRKRTISSNLSLLETLTCFRESWFSGSIRAESEWKKSTNASKEKRTPPHFIKSHNPGGSVKSPPSEEDSSFAGVRLELPQKPQKLHGAWTAVMQEEVGRAPAGHPAGKARGLRFPKRSRQEGVHSNAGWGGKQTRKPRALSYSVLKVRSVPEKWTSTLTPNSILKGNRGKKQ